MNDSTAKFTCSAVILSGGLSSRMGGRNKAFLEVGGQTILDRLVGAFSGILDEVLIVTKEPSLYEDYPIRVVPDIHEGRASLIGIHAGLCQMKTDFAFIVPCDTPFIKPELIRRILHFVRADLDVVVPVIEGYYEPLCAVYSKRCIAEIENQLDTGNYRIFDFFDKIKLETISGEELKLADPELVSFFNVNTPEAFDDSGNIIAPPTRRRK